MSIIINNNEPKTYVILGMHKSGTSIIAKALQEQNISINCSKEETRTFEDKCFLDLNERVFKYLNTSWDNPPTEKEIESVVDLFKDSAEVLINEHKGLFWGWKDPRTSLTFPIYKDYLKDDTYLICVFRKPKYLEDKGISKDCVNIYNKAIINNIKTFLGL